MKGFHHPHLGNKIWMFLDLNRLTWPISRGRTGDKDTSPLIIPYMTAYKNLIPSVDSFDKTLLACSVFFHPPQNLLFNVRHKWKKPQLLNREDSEERCKEARGLSVVEWHAADCRGLRLSTDQIRCVSMRVTTDLGGFKKGMGQFQGGRSYWLLFSHDGVR